MTEPWESEIRDAEWNRLKDNLTQPHRITFFRGLDKISQGLDDNVPPSGLQAAMGGRSRPLRLSRLAIRPLRRAKTGSHGAENCKEPSGVGAVATRNQVVRG